ncbi:methyltransferase domain-containing protein [Gordoniibacillus kamchatkensis]|uniref:methyltransferase domain-containing protein n=1 Tax=Gordoniibacillus kamchatkensis TaxID=1590651 RepID=UPI000695CD2C|nr:methyltransferase domain-containing protein [Paenibacillus sp. VKM B-2647]
MAHLFATVLPGLEHVLENEIKVKIADAKLQGSERGKVYFASGWPAEALMGLRTADNLYERIHRFRVGPHKLHLADIEREICRLDLSWAARSYRTGEVLFKVNASRAGKHTYSRFDAAEAAARGIARRDSRFRHNADGMHEVEFRLDIHHDDALFALKLTDASFRFRNGQRSFALAALRPTVAHALVWLSNPAATDVFVDPCCGSGTILSERLAYPHRQIAGGDLSEEAVEAAKANAGIHHRVGIHHWDARRLPIDSGSVHKIVTNLPFGRQIAADEPIPELYRGIVKEINRVLHNNGSALCLTDADAELQSAAERVQLSCTKVAALSLKGLHPTLYMLEKR